jgi:hypothetical protein
MIDLEGSPALQHREEHRAEDKTENFMCFKTSATFYVEKLT